jgi:hypothetical protein
MDCFWNIPYKYGLLDHLLHPLLLFRYCLKAAYARIGPSVHYGYRHQVAGIKNSLGIDLDQKALFNHLHGP